MTEVYSTGQGVWPRVKGNSGIQVGVERQDRDVVRGKVRGQELHTEQKGHWNKSEFSFHQRQMDKQGIIEPESQCQLPEELKDSKTKTKTLHTS